MIQYSPQCYGTIMLAFFKLELSSLPKKAVGVMV